MATSKKVTKVGGDETTSRKSTSSTGSIDKGKARQLRLFAILSWILALIAEAVAIYYLYTCHTTNGAGEPIETKDMVWLISFIAIDLVFVIIGNLLWKKANHQDPASKQNKVKFYIQNQLGVIIAAIAFLPLIIIIFKNKNLTSNQKKLLGGIGIVALLIGSYVGIDFDPLSAEDQVKLVDVNNVYWTNSGTKYHIDGDCQHIKASPTRENGTLERAKELNKNELCKTCETRARKAKGIDLNSIPDTEEETTEDSGGGGLLDLVGSVIGD